MPSNSNIPFIDLTDTLNTQRLRVNRLIDSIGNVSSLTTTADNITQAIIEHDAELGPISSGDMGTTANTVSEAIAELDGRLDSINTTELLSPRATLSDSAATNIVRGNLQVDTDLHVGGNTTNTGSVTIDGLLTSRANVVIGNSAGDQLYVNSSINTNVVPYTDSAFSLGSASKQWKDLHVNGYGYIDDIRSDNIVVSNDVSVSNNVTVSNDLEVQGISNLDSTNVAGDLDVTGSFTTITTDGLTEGSNQYFTTARARASFSEGTGIDITSGVVSLIDSTAGAVLAINGTSNEIDVSRSNGTVTVGLPNDVTIGNNLTVSNDLNVTGGFTVSGTFTVTGEQRTAAQYIQLLDGTSVAPSQDAGITVDRGTSDSAVFQWNETGDYWEAGTTASRKQIARQFDSAAFTNIQQTGSGALRLPAGTTAERPSAAQGQIRYNQTTTSFEGYNGTSWGSLGGLIDVDQDTKIIAERASGTDSDTLQFQTGGVLRATLNSTALDITTDSGITVGTTRLFDGGIEDTGTLSVNSPADITGNLDVTGNITVSGTVDGRDIATDGTKLDGIEANAKDDQTITAGTGLTGGGTGDVTISLESTLNNVTDMVVTGDFTVDATGDIILDAQGQDIYFKNGTGGDTWTWNVPTNGIGSFVTPGSFSWEIAGDYNMMATSNAFVMYGANGSIGADSTGQRLYFDIQPSYQRVTASDDFELQTDDGHIELKTSGTDKNITLDATGNIILDVDSSNILFKNGGGLDTWTWTLNDDATGSFTSPDYFTLEGVGGLELKSSYLFGGDNSLKLTSYASIYADGNSFVVTGDSDLQYLRFYGFDGVGNAQEIQATDGLRIEANEDIFIGNAQNINAKASGSGGNIVIEAYTSHPSIGTDGLISLYGETGVNIRADNGEINMQDPSTGGEINFSLGSSQQQINAYGELYISSTNSSRIRFYSADEIYLDAFEDIILDAKTGIIDLYHDGAQDVRFDVATTDTLKLYTGTSTLNSTFEGDDLTVQGDVTSLSDIRTKENVETVENGLDLVSQLRGVWYNKIGEEDRKVGVVAQEVEEVLPEVVKTDTEGMKSVDYSKMVGVLIEAIKELKSEIDQLKAGE